MSCWKSSPCSRHNLANTQIATRCSHLRRFHRKRDVHVSLLSLLHLLARCTQGIKPLIDYSQSHVVTFVDYLNVLHKKVINKTSVDNIKEAQVKEREDKWTKKVANAQGIATKVVQKIANKIAKVKFVVVWSITTISRVGDWFHW